MDQDTNVSQVQPGNSASSTVRTLTRLVPYIGTDPTVIERQNHRLLQIWKRLLTQDYALDDFARQLGPQAFLGQLFDPSNEFYEYGDDGLAVASNIIPKCNALVHFVNWGDVEPREILDVQHLWFADLFSRHQLNRLTAYIPLFNKPAIRLAVIAGFRYEGELRKMFLTHGTYHNLTVYGLLKSEFYRREEARA